MPPKRDLGSSPGRGRSRQHDPSSSAQTAAVVDRPVSSSGTPAADDSAEHGQPPQREVQGTVEGQDQGPVEDQLSEESLDGGGEHDDSVPLRSELEPQCDAAAPREAVGVVQPMDDDDDTARESEQNGLLGSTQDAASSLAPATASEKGASLAQTYITFFKSFVGIAILGLPHAFSLAGYVLAPLGFLLVCYLSFYCMRLLLACKTLLAASSQQLSLTDSAQGIGYQDVARIALGRRGQVLTEFCLVTSQMGFLVGYLIFIGANAPPALHALGGPRISSFGCVLVVSLALAPLVCLRSIKKLSGSALLANLAILFGIGESTLHGCAAIRETAPVPAVLEV